MLTYDQGRDNFTKLAQQYKPGDLNEAMTRLQFIDALFFECLGWSRETDVEVEDHVDGEYADYVFHDVKSLMVVEAKREGVYFEVPAGFKEVERSLNNMLKDEPEIKKACRQAMGYANERGISLAVVCNGHQLIAFVATRQDGVKPLEGKALVFGSLEQMEKHFLELWQALSKAGVLDGILVTRLTKDLATLLPPTLAARINPYPGTKQRNAYQADLKIIAELVLEDLIKKPEKEEEYLKNCYCTSGALPQYSLETKDILRQRYAALVDEADPGPVTDAVIEDKGKAKDLLSEGIGRRPILLLGDVGAGKTSFIRNLIKVEAKEFFKKALPIYLDLGSKATLTDDLHQVIVSECRQQLKVTHRIDILKSEFVERVYKKDVEEWEKSIIKKIKEANQDLYGLELYKFLKTKQDNQIEHLKQSIKHIVTGHQKPVVLFLDNLDQRSPEIQEQAYLIAHEMSTDWYMTVFVTIRPETFHTSRRANVLSGYHPKAFTIAPPRVDTVIKKRLDYALALTAGEFKVGSGTAKVSILRSILAAFINTLETTEDVTACLENLSNGNVRAALDIVRDFFGSGHVDTRKIAEIQELEDGYTIPLHEMVRAIVFGDHVHYDPTRSRLIANLFQISTPDPKEHFLTPILIMGTLGLRQGASTEGGFVPVGEVYALCQRMGFSPNQIEAALKRCYEKNLILTGARRGPQTADSIRPTTSGLYHVERLLRVFGYVDAMIVDTPILDPAAQVGIKDVDAITTRLARCRTFVNYLDAQWKASRLPNTPFDWNKYSSALRGQIDHIHSKLRDD